MATADRSEGGEVLARLMARRGLSAPEVSRKVEGDLGASTVRAYTAGRSKPRPGKAVAIARIFDTQGGATLLRAWGYDDLAEGLLEESDRRDLEFPMPNGPTDSEFPARSFTPGLGQRVSLTILAIGETMGGGAVWVATMDSGGLVGVIPLKSVEGIGVSVE